LGAMLTLHYVFHNGVVSDQEIISNWSTVLLQFIHDLWHWACATDYLHDSLGTKYFPWPSLSKMTIHLRLPMWIL